MKCYALVIDWESFGVINYLRSIVCCVGVLVCAACEQEANDQHVPAADVESAVKAAPQSAAALAVAHPDRPSADLLDDDKRKPIEVLEFSQIKAGDTVIEMEAGQGYYTELISRIVGETGVVHMQNPRAFDSFLGDAVAVRLQENRLPNVSILKTNFDFLPMRAGTTDVVTWFLGPHDLYFTPATGESLGNDKRAYKGIFNVLRSGGSFVVLDHAAAPGSSKATGGSTHRIDPEIVKALALEAGFVLDAESDQLRNANDDYGKGVTDPSVRRNTDRFLIRFVKP